MMMKHVFVACMVAVHCVSAYAFTIPGLSGLTRASPRQLSFQRRSHASARALRSPGASRLMASEGMTTRIPAADTLPIGIDDSDYIAFGLAHCYTMDEGSLEDYWIMEPLTGATLECITNGVTTSYKKVMALTAGQVLTGGTKQPVGINLDALMPLVTGEQFDAHLCEDVLQRTLAAGRTLKRRVESQIVPIGETRDNYNFQPTANKRVLNMVREVNDADNVKQDISIDVYGRDSEIV